MFQDRYTGLYHMFHLAGISGHRGLDLQLEGRKTSTTKSDHISHTPRVLIITAPPYIQLLDAYNNSHTQGIVDIDGVYYFTRMCTLWYNTSRYSNNTLVLCIGVVHVHHGCSGGFREGTSPPF